jgi:hypothetical protein
MQTPRRCCIGVAGREQHFDESARFLTYTTATVAAFSILAIAWTALPALFVPACA